MMDLAVRAPVLAAFQIVFLLAVVVSPARLRALRAAL
jgi:hypothetical protein